MDVSLLRSQSLIESLERLSTESDKKEEIELHCDEVKLAGLSKKIEEANDGIELFAKSLIKLGTMIEALESHASSNKSGNLKSTIRTSEARARLREKFILKKESLENVNSGIEFVKNKIEQQEAEKALQERAKKAEDAMKQLLKEEEAAQRRRTAKLVSPVVAKKKTKKKSSPAAKKSDPVQELIHETKPVSSSIKRKVKKPSAISYKEKLAKFVFQLCQGSSSVVEEPRVRRWKTKNLDNIRKFKDKNRDGELIFRYQDLDDEKILEQRARHFLPGTERLLKDSYRSIYSFPTNTGYGFVAQFMYNDEVHDGVLYVGLDKANKLFHKYFENMNFNDSRRDIFKDSQARVFEFEDKDDDSEEWQSVQTDFNVDISDEGVLAFSYGDHAIRIFPLNKELFKRSITKIK